MKNKTPVLDQRSQVKIPDWLYQEAQEDDFLLGKTANNLESAWEDEE